MSRRFTNPQLTRRGRIGHPANLESKLISCAGVRFVDQALQCQWVFRRYEEWGVWPVVEVWTKADRIPATRTTSMGFENQTRVEEVDVPQEVVLFALANLVRFRLKGRVPA